MRQRILVSSALILVLSLTACAGQAPAAQTQQPAKPATEATKPVVQVTQPAPQATKPVEPAKPAAQQAKPDAVEAFYKGKTVTMIVSHSAGGGYDLYARLLARHIGKYIPGNPTVIVQNMPGAGGFVAANHLYNVAAKDGTVIATVDRGLPAEQLIGTEGVQFDSNKFNWLGSMNEEVSVCVSRSDTSVKTFEDVFKTPLRIGGTGPGADTDMFPSFFNAVLGTKFDLITGYPGTNEVSIAIERNEVQGRCGWSWSSVMSTRPNWVKDKFINLLVQIALNKHADLPDVPLAMDYAKDEKTKNLFEVVFSRQTMGRPYLAPPGVPADRVDALRKAFKAALGDAQLKDEATKAKQELGPVFGEELQSIVERVMKTPKDRAELLAKYIKAERQ